MIKTKWLELSAQLSISQISEGLSRIQFRKGLTSGFELIEVNRTALRGKFFEEIIANEVFIDPFGEEIQNSVRRYSIFEFSIFQFKKYGFILKINNPSRSLKSFIQDLSEALGFGYSIRPFDIDILRLTQHLRYSTGYKGWTIKRVRISGVRLTDSSLAKIEVISQIDAHKDLREYVNLKDSILERATIALTKNNEVQCCEATHTGVIIADSIFLDSFSSHLYSYFAD